MSAGGIAILATAISVLGAFALHRVVLRILKDDSRPEEDDPKT